MKTTRMIFAAAVLNVGLLSAAFGQAAPAGSAPSTANTMVSPAQSNNPVDGEMERKLQEMIQAQNGNPHAGETPEQIAKDQEQEFIDADNTAKALHLSCYLMGNRLVSAGKENVGGTTVKAKVYEINCANGMGYFVVSQNPQAPTGFSCFSADGQRAALAVRGQKFADVCSLPANNLDAGATKIMTNAGTPCKVTRLSWFGQSAATNTEYTEVACSNGNGYLLATALPGSPMQMAIIGCADAATRGMNCTLTKVAAPPPGAASADPVPTTDMLKAALAQHGVACTVTDMRVIGRENGQKRHVVEFKCPEQPKGLVAFIPLGSNPAKFQTLDCPTAAAKAKIMCKIQG